MTDQPILAGRSEQGARDRAAWLPDAAEIRGRLTLKMWISGAAAALIVILSVANGSVAKSMALILLNSAWTLEAWGDRRIVDHLAAGLSGREVTARLDRPEDRKWSWSLAAIFLAAIVLALLPISTSKFGELGWTLCLVAMFGWQLCETLLKVRHAGAI